MSWGGVYETIGNGNLGGKPVNAIGALVFVGPCSLGEKNTPYYLTRDSDIAALLGQGDLPDRLRDFFAVGGRYAIAVPSNADVAGTFGAVDDGSSGSADMNTPTGSVNAAYDMVVEILTGGNFNEATFRYSPDGGDNWYGPYTIPEQTTPPNSDPFVVPGTGISLTWNDAGAGSGSFVEGDYWQFATVAPTSSISALMEAHGVPLDVPFEGRVTATPTGAAAWASLNTVCMADYQGHKPTFMICEAPLPSDAELADDDPEGAYTTARLALTSGLDLTFLMIAAGWAEVADKLGQSRRRGVSGIAAGLLSASPVQRSLGNTQYCKVSNVLRVFPAGEAAQIALDEGRFTVLRRHVGLDGFYFNNGNMIASATSDYLSIERLRMILEVIRQVRVTALGFVHSDILVQDGVASKEGLKHLEGGCNQTLGRLQARGDFSSGRIEIPEGQDVLATESISANINITPKGQMKKIELTFQLVRL